MFGARLLPARQPGADDERKTSGVLPAVDVDVRQFPYHPRGLRLASVAVDLQRGKLHSQS